MARTGRVPGFRQCTSNGSDSRAGPAGVALSAGPVAAVGFCMTDFLLLLPPGTLFFQIPYDLQRFLLDWQHGSDRMVVVNQASA